MCNGLNGTPDLRSRFVIGAGGEYIAGNIGGSKTKNISHTHTFSGKTNTEDKEDIDNGNHPLDILPPYYALCYIMKL